jgi:hypothetical protein
MNLQEFVVAERRKHPRSRVLKSAKLILGSSSVIDCVVRNLTNIGARVVVPNTTMLPEHLHLTFDDGRTRYACKIVWRRLNETGLEFLE